MPAGLRTGAEITDRKIASSVDFSAIAAFSGSAAGMLATAHPFLQRRLMPLVAAKNQDEATKNGRRICVA
jgi:hypothetical protein